MIRKELQRHPFAYVILFGGLALLGATFLHVWPDKILQRAIIGCMVLFYLVWGLVTHVTAEHLTHRIFAEYLMVSLLGGIVLFVVTL